MKNKLCISSRVRIARNIKGVRFCNKLTDSQSLGIIDEVRGALGNEYSYINFSHLNQSKKNAFVEQHLVSREFADSERKKALFLSPDRTVSVMIGEEDHIRIQAFAEGLDLNKALTSALKIEEKLSKQIEFMFDEQYGYITKCPTNIGTGIRASVMMFLPATFTHENASYVADTLRQKGMTIRGLFGEGSFAVASLYQISNNITLGLSEEDIVKKVEETVSALEQAEETEEQKIIQSNPDHYIDDCMRALGVLRSAYIISSSEAISLISKVMLGTVTDIISCKKSSRDLYNIILSVLPFTLSDNADIDIFSAKERDKYRAAYLRKVFEQK